MLPKQQSFILNPYIELYNLLIPKDNLLRRMDELVDFSFVYEELRESYCHDNGRTAVDPVRMFKYLLLKSIFDLSDVDLVERTKTDLSFKFFLHMAPEETVIEPSLLTKFRKLRLKDMKLLDLLIGKTVESPSKRVSSVVNLLLYTRLTLKLAIPKRHHKRYFESDPKSCEKAFTHWMNP